MYVLSAHDSHSALNRFTPEKYVEYSTTGSCVSFLKITRRRRRRKMLAKDVFVYSSTDLRQNVDVVVDITKIMESPLKRSRSGRRCFVCNYSYSVVQKYTPSTLFLIIIWGLKRPSEVFLIKM